MLTIQAISMVAFLAILPTGVLCHPALRIRDVERAGCRPCGDECEACEYGVAYSPFCGVLECRKGPDEHCGARGTCGDGMYCLCERCFGCSTDNLKCSDLTPTCLPRETRYRNLQRSRQFTMV
ncbi:uncharacterized protein LOC107036071 [Diachasma alloeum]|uniref:uncharacterized protein LOC107036071 n=1 Tax=Diachasma alloeum TaxID=454923 RepID=UPI0007384E4B|nr:uncharacterized protein LOC107036071 [Diachasma alloeum]